MAKVVGPLMSMDARGKLANALVFIGWRGIKDVRTWKKPANPRTEAQQLQRGRFTEAVMKHHTLSGADKMAWDKSAAGQPLSGFNLFVKKVVDALVGGKTWQLIYNVEVEDITNSGATITGITDNAALLRIEYGTSPANLVYYADEPTGRTQPGTFEISLTNLIPGTTYYFKVKTKSPNAVVGETGIYSFTTTTS